MAIYNETKYAEVEKVILPPSDGNRNDIALVKLIHPLKFNEMVQPACLPDHYDYRKYEGVLKVNLYFVFNFFSKFEFH